MCNTSGGAGVLIDLGASSHLATILEGARKSTRIVHVLEKVRGIGCCTSGPLRGVLLSALEQQIEFHAIDRHRQHNARFRMINSANHVGLVRVEFDGDSDITVDGRQAKRIAVRRKVPTGGVPTEACEEKFLNVCRVHSPGLGCGERAFGLRKVLRVFTALLRETFSLTCELRRAGRVSRHGRERQLRRLADATESTPSSMSRSPDEETHFVRASMSGELVLPRSSCTATPSTSTLARHS